MFDILFLGWRKASKCKNLIRHVQCRLKFLKSKRYAIIRQFRHDIAQLINNGQHQIAFSRVEQLFNDQNLMVAYELLDNFCEFIIINLRYMRRNKDCPNDIKEAMSSLIYAAAHCGDLPELQIIRKLFGQRYGHTLAETAANLLPGNMVNKQLAEKLNITSVSDEAKLVLMDEIVRDYNRPVGLLSWENTLSIQNYELCGNSPPQQEDKSDGTKKIPMLFLNLRKNLFSTSCVSRAAGFVLEPIKFKTGQRNIIEIAKVSSEQCAKHLESRMDIARPATSSENSCQLLENMVVYLDDIEEYQASEVSDCIGKDQRVFLFNELSDFHDIACEEDRVNRPNSRNERAIMNTSNIGKTKLSRRSTSREQKMTYQTHHKSPTSNIKDIEWELYYGEPHTHTFSSTPKFCGNQLHHQRKHRRRMPSQAGRSSSFACCENLGVCPSCEWKYRSQTSCSSHRFSRQMEFNCCLEHPCCICPSDDTDNIVQEKMFIGCHSLNNNRKTFQFKSCAGETEEEFSACPAISASSLASSSRNSTPCAKAMAKGPYSRALTMPPERPKGAQVTNMARSSSFVTPTSSRFRHVHPKLPDYDEIAAKFQALKKDHLQSAGHQNA
ncbi:Vacuolar protein sorting-associated protein Ist1 [Dillenia turbinata]|uniref:Vacuolar protein sorting-associated protein Ist1 n=1 Tax=Dillenia turbinata TaxID=194707 RepID=A0AAN8YY84_9MAGN